VTYEDIVLAGITLCLIAALIVIDRLRHQLEDASKRLRRLAYLLDQADRAHRYVRY